MQEARHIVAALMQHFTYNEFLPMVLGKEVMHNNDLVLLKDGYWNKYDQFLNPSTSNGFTIAFRWPIACSSKIYDVPSSGLGTLSSPPQLRGGLRTIGSFYFSLFPSSLWKKLILCRYMGSQKLSEMLQQPYDLYKAGWADDYVLGLINQVPDRILMKLVTCPYEAI